MNKFNIDKPEDMAIPNEVKVALKDFIPEDVLTKAKRLSSEIKNRLNPYILNRMETLGETPVVTDEWLDMIEEGCQILIADLNVRKGIAREHLVAYILAEYGVEAFGMKNPVAKPPTPNVDAVVKQILKDKKPKKKKNK